MTRRIDQLTAADLDDARALAVLADVRVRSADAWAADLARVDTVLLGLWDGDALVGIATGAMAIDDADVHLVAVDPAHRRQGHGAALTRALCATFAGLGAERVLLEVREDNTAARTLYASLGFEEVARRSSYYGGGEDALVLARPSSVTVPDGPSAPGRATRAGG